MFKVECEGCQAPYQVDERRVPPTGLKMRCPKCGASFVVHLPGASAAEQAELPAALPAKPAGAKPPPAPSLADLPASLGGRAAPRPAAGPPGAPAAMMGPPSAPAETVRGAPQLGSFDDLDLDLPAALGPAPARPRPAAGRAAGDVDLPAAAGPPRPKGPPP